MSHSSHLTVLPVALQEEEFRDGVPEMSVHDFVVEASDAGAVREELNTGFSKYVDSGSYEAAPRPGGWHERQESAFTGTAQASIAILNKVATETGTGLLPSSAPLCAAVPGLSAPSSAIAGGVPPSGVGGLPAAQWHCRPASHSRHCQQACGPSQKALQPCGCSRAGLQEGGRRGLVSQTSLSLAQTPT